MSIEKEHIAGRIRRWVDAYGAELSEFQIADLAGSLAMWLHSEKAAPMPGAAVPATALTDCPSCGFTFRVMRERAADGSGAAEQVLVDHATAADRAELERLRSILRHLGGILGNEDPQTMHYAASRAVGDAEAWKARAEGHARELRAALDTPKNADKHMEESAAAAHREVGYLSSAILTAWAERPSDALRTVVRIDGAGFPVVDVGGAHRVLLPEQDHDDAEVEPGIGGSSAAHVRRVGPVSVGDRHASARRAAGEPSRDGEDHASRSSKETGVEGARLDVGDDVVIRGRVVEKDADDGMLRVQYAASGSDRFAMWFRPDQLDRAAPFTRPAGKGDT